MSSLTPKPKQIKRFMVAGFSTRTQNSDEFDHKKAKLPTLWQHFYSSSISSNQIRFGVYSNYESEADGFYSTTAGIMMEEAKTGLSSVIVEAGRYLVFQGTGPRPATVVAIWQHVWNFFGPGSRYQRNYVSDFEEYRGMDEVAVYIGIK